MDIKVGDVVNIPAEVIAVGKVKGTDGEVLKVFYVVKTQETDFDYIVDTSEEEDEL